MLVYLYVISISMQVAGALILSIFSLSAKRKNVIISFINKDLIHQDGDTKELSYDEKEFKNTFKKIYLGRCSFLYIAIGYFLGIFAENEGINKFSVFVYVLILTTILISGTYGIILLIIKKSRKVNKVITNEELEEIGLSPNIATISKEEIDEICNSE